MHQKEGKATIPYKGSKAPLCHDTDQHTQDSTQDAQKQRFATGQTPTTETNESARESNCVESLLGDHGEAEDTQAAAEQATYRAECNVLDSLSRFLLVRFFFVLLVFFF